MEPGPQWAFDVSDLPPSIFDTAAEVWTAYRRGEIDAERYGVDPELPLRGGWFVKDYVLQELAHRQRDELLLWDRWGAMPDLAGGLAGGPDGGLAGGLAGDLGLVDEVAALLLAADAGDDSAERKLAKRYATDPALNPNGRAVCSRRGWRQDVTGAQLRVAVAAHAERRDTGIHLGQRGGRRRQVLGG